MRAFLPIVLPLTACFVGSAHAQEVPTPPLAPAPAIDPGADRISVGVGAGVMPSYIGSNESVVVPVVAVVGQIHGITFNTQGTQLTVDVIPDSGKPGWKLQAGPVIALRLDRNSKIRDRAVKALGKIDAAWELGGWLGIQRTGVVTSPYDKLSLSLAWQRDVNDVYNSYIVSPQLEYSTPLSTKAYVDFSLGADYVGRRFGATYYDVTPSGSAASGLAAYDGADRAGWKDWNANLLVARSLSGDLTHGVAVFAMVNYMRLVGVYARSPIVADVGNPSQWSGGIGIGYTF